MDAIGIFDTVISHQELVMDARPKVFDDCNMHSRRQLMRTAACAIGGIVTVMAASPAQAKMSQKAAEYQATPKDGQSCANCSLYRAPSSCTLIDGTIVPTGYCRFYIKK